MTSSTRFPAGGGGADCVQIESIAACAQEPQMATPGPTVNPIQAAKSRPDRKAPG